MSVIATSTNSLIPQQKNPMDLATLKHQMVRYNVKDLTMTGPNTIEIKPSPNAFINLSKSKLVVTCRIKNQNGHDLDYDPAVPMFSDVSPTNAFLWTMFKNFSVYSSSNKNECMFTSYHGHYGLVKYIQLLREQKRRITFGRTDSFSLDSESGPEETSMTAGNTGCATRGELFLASRTVTLSGDLAFPFSQEDVLLPPGTSLFFEMEIGSNAWNLLIPQQLLNNAGVRVADQYYQLQVLSISVDVSETFLRNEAFLGYTDLLKKSDFTRFYTDYMVKVGASLKTIC